VTAPYGGQTVTITNLNGIYSQSIKPGFDVYGLALTNNILLAHSSYEFAVWWLTKEGMVDRVSGNETSDQDGRLWTKPVPIIFDSQLWVDSCYGVIYYSETECLYYNTETGEELESVPVKVPLHHTTSSWNNIHSPGYYKCQYPLSHYEFSEHDDPSEDNLQVSIPWYKEGWVKYPEGKHWHKFWLPVHWCHHARFHGIFSPLFFLKRTISYLSSTSFHLLSHFKDFPKHDSYSW